MKHLIVIGASRSGKSSLATMLRKKLGYNILSLDDLAHAFGGAFPDIGIHENSLNNSALLEKFVEIYIQTQIKYTYPDMPIVVEGAHISIDDAQKITKIAPDLFEIITIGYPNIAPQSKVAQIRKYDTATEWSTEFSDEELTEQMIRGINYSRELRDQSIKLGIKFLDTSTDRVRVLKRFVSELSKRI